VLPSGSKNVNTETEDNDEGPANQENLISSVVGIGNSDISTFSCDI
jgi:hypothetical protein